METKACKRIVGGQVRTVVDLLEADTGVPRDCLPAEMDDRVGWRKKTMGGSTKVGLVVVVIVCLYVCLSVCDFPPLSDP